MKRRTFLRGLSAGTALGVASRISGCPPRSKRVHVLGSGITGLCAGALLAKAGFQVRVLEAHPQMIGGHAATFEKAGFRFCVGPQYVWNFRSEGVGVRILHHLGLADTVSFDTMDPDGFEVFRIGDESQVSIPMGLDRFRETAIDAHPGDYTGLELFFSYLEDLHKGAEVIDRYALYTRGEAAMMAALLLTEDLAAGAKVRFHQCRRWSLSQLFDHCELAPDSRRMLYADSGLYAENESAVSCVAYAAATGFYHAGADYPRRGFDSLVQGLVDCITNAGGSVDTDKAVTKLHRRGAQVTRVECADGESFDTDLVISTLSPRTTFPLVDPPICWVPRYAPSNAVISAFVGVRDHPELPGRLARRGLWWQDGLGEVEFQAPDMSRPPRFLALASPSSNGNQNTNANPRDHSLTVFAPGSFAQAAEAFSRGVNAHDDLRDHIADMLLDVIDRQLLPGVREYIRFAEVQTPYDLYLRTRGEVGNVYGRRLTPASLLAKPFTEVGVQNLHIACATAGMPGIATAFQVAKVLVEQLTGLELLPEK